MLSIDLQSLARRLQKNLIVSIQPVPHSPLDTTDIIVAMAKALQNCGVPALRIEGVQRVKAVTQAVSVPIIGIVKRDLSGSDVRITPYAEDVAALAQAGATIIAFDATARSRPQSRDQIAAAIKRSGCFGMADCCCFADGQWAHEHGVELIGTTLSGYTGTIVPDNPDFKLVQAFAKAGFLTIAEGRYNTPELAKRAIDAGALAVTVGSALTRLEIATSWFQKALS